MHIVLLYKDYPPVSGGIEGHTATLARGLVARGHQVTVLVTNTTGTTTVAHTRAGLTVIRAGRLATLSSTPLSLAYWWRARQFAHVDVVHLQFPYPPADLAARLIPHAPPLVVTYQADITRQRWLRVAYAPLLRATLRRARRIIVTSTAYMQHSYWLQPHRARCRVVPLGIDAHRFAPAPMPRPAGAMPTLLFVGRLRYYKGLPYLLHALARMRQPCRLVIAGDGPEAPHVRTLVAALGLADRVTLLGDVPDADLPGVYQQADVFVLPSHLPAEAFGIVLLEAQASGLPVISTALGTATSIVNRHGQTGLVVPPADAHALAHAADWLLAHPHRAHQMGAAGRANVLAHYTHELMLTQTEQVYQSVL